MITSYRLTAITAFGNVEWHDLKASDEATAIEEGIAKFESIQRMDVPRRGSEGYPHYNEARVVRVNKYDSGNVSEANVHVIL